MIYKNGKELLCLLDKHSVFGTFTTTIFNLSHQILFEIKPCKRVAKLIAGGDKSEFNFTGLVK
jgi:hypothetical protein